VKVGAIVTWWGPWGHVSFFLETGDIPGKAEQKLYFFVKRHWGGGGGNELPDGPVPSVAGKQCSKKKTMSEPHKKGKKESQVEGETRFTTVPVWTSTMRQKNPLALERFLRRLRDSYHSIQREGAVEANSGVINN